MPSDSAAIASATVAPSSVRLILRSKIASIAVSRSPSPGDLRRTWKTLAGKAGVPKEIRDRIQNHAFHDVSSKSYDRWTYMPEKRAGMEQWNTFVTALLTKKVSAAAAA
jgi:hypothetical protein